MALFGASFIFTPSFYPSVSVRSAFDEAVRRRPGKLITLRQKARAIQKSVAQFRRCGLFSRAASEAPMKLLLLTLVVLAGLVVFQAYRNQCFWHGPAHATDYTDCLSKF